MHIQYAEGEREDSERGDGEMIDCERDRWWREERREVRGRR